MWAICYLFILTWMLFPWNLTIHNDNFKISLIFCGPVYRAAMIHKVKTSRCIISLLIRIPRLKLEHWSWEHMINSGNNTLSAVHDYTMECIQYSWYTPVAYNFNFTITSLFYCSKSFNAILSLYIQLSMDNYFHMT